MGWGGVSPDDQIFYYTDGLKYQIYEYDFDINHGTILNQRIFVQLEKSPIEPDGLTISSEGYIRQAQWNSGKIFRYAPAPDVAKKIKSLKCLSNVLRVVFSADEIWVVYT